MPVRVKAGAQGWIYPQRLTGIELYVTVNFYPNGKIADCLSPPTRRNSCKGLLASLSKAISNMLQYNIPPRKFPVP